jgi:hypothetical protein
MKLNNRMVLINKLQLVKVPLLLMNVSRQRLKGLNVLENYRRTSILWAC